MIRHDAFVLSDAFSIQKSARSLPGCHSLSIFQSLVGTDFALLRDAVLLGHLGLANCFAANVPQLLPHQIRACGYTAATPPRDRFSRDFVTAMPPQRCWKPGGRHTKTPGISRQSESCDTGISNWNILERGIAEFSPQLLDMDIMRKRCFRHFFRGAPRQSGKRAGVKITD